MFNAVLLASCAYGWWRGGTPERVAATLFLSAAAITYLLPFDRSTSFHHVEWNFLAVDAVLFLALVALALVADRFWPMWLAAMQLVTVAVHGVRAYEPGLLALTYSLVASKLAYGTLVVLVIGAVRHRARRGGRGAEHDWTFQRRRLHAVHGSPAGPDRSDG